MTTRENRTEKQRIEDLETEINKQRTINLLIVQRFEDMTQTLLAMAKVVSELKGDIHAAAGMDHKRNSN